MKSATTLRHAGSSPVWLPDSKRILFYQPPANTTPSGATGVAGVHGRQLAVLDPQTGREHGVLTVRGVASSWGRLIDVSRDGRRLAFLEAQGEGDIWLAKMGR